MLKSIYLLNGFETLKVCVKSIVYSEYVVCEMLCHYITLFYRSLP